MALGSTPRWTALAPSQRKRVESATEVGAPTGFAGASSCAGRTAARTPGEEAHVAGALPVQARTWYAPGGALVGTVFFAVSLREARAASLGAFVVPGSATSPALRFLSSDRYRRILAAFERAPPRLRALSGTLSGLPSSTLAGVETTFARTFGRGGVTCTALALHALPTQASRFQRPGLAREGSFASRATVASRPGSSFGTPPDASRRSLPSRLSFESRNASLAGRPADVPGFAAVAVTGRIPCADTFLSACSETTEIPVAA